MPRTSETVLMSRRMFAGAGIAATGLVWTRAALAQKPLTAESAMGPFYPLELPADHDADLTWIKGHDRRATGKVIEVSGRVFDMKGNVIPNARIDLWQANAAGRYIHPADVSTAPVDPHFHGIASLRSDSQGAWRIVTIKPGGYDSPIGSRPPHIHFDVRGNIHRNVAQLYFPEEAEGNRADSLYKALGDQAATSLAKRDPNDPDKYVWDIVLMG